MNERIKQLYTEASEWALHNYPPPVNPFEWEDLRSKKFAELIVKECAKNAVLFADSTTTQGLPSKYIENYMLKHFGVEL